MTNGDMSGRSGDDVLSAIGMVLLATDLTTERDMRCLVPHSLRVCATRIAFENPTTPGNLRLTLPRLADAAALLVPGVALTSLYFSCTAATATLGHDVVEQAIHKGRPGVRVITPLSAAETAFDALGVRRIAILTPYVPETADQVTSYFNRLAPRVVHAHAMGMADDRDMAQLSADVITAAAERADHADAEALFISCTALPAATLAPEIEQRLGKPVVTSNLAGLWLAMHLAGHDSSDARHGRLMAHCPLEAAA